MKKRKRKSVTNYIFYDDFPTIMMIKGRSSNINGGNEERQMVSG